MRWPMRATCGPRPALLVPLRRSTVALSSTDGRGELTPVVAVDGEEQLAAAAAASGQRLAADLELVTPQRSRGQCPWRAAVRGQRPLTEAAELREWTARQLLLARVRQGPNADCLTAAGAVRWGRIDGQQIAACAGAVGGEVGHNPLDGVGEPAATFEVTGLAGQSRERVVEATSPVRLGAPV